MDGFQIWVDASYAIHNDKRGYTGGLMSIGIGAEFIINVLNRS